MKRVEINNALNNSSIKDLVSSQKGGSWKLHDLLVEELGEDQCPSETAIITYIKKQLNLIWDQEKHLWTASKEDANPTKKNRKKRKKKSPETFTKIHEIEIDDNNNSTLKEEDSSFNEKSTNSNLSEKSNNLLESKNEEKSTSNNTDNKSSNINESLKSEKINNVEKDISKIEDSSSNSKFKYKNIDPSRYLEYIEYCGSQKYSLSLSPFVIGLTEEIILEKYNKRQMSKSKIVQLALIEFIRISTKDITTGISY